MKSILKNCLRLLALAGFGAAIFLVWFLVQLREEMSDEVVLKVDGEFGALSVLVRPVFWDEGDPGLLLRIDEPGGEGEIARLGGIKGWSRGGGADLEVREFEEFKMIVYSGRVDRPLVVWSEAVGDVIPASSGRRSRGQHNIDLMALVAKEVGREACLGYLGSDGLACRNDNETPHSSTVQ